MSVEKVEKYLSQHHMRDRLQIFDVSSATVELAAQALGVEPARIAKSISFYARDGGCVILVAAGDAKIDNAGFKAEFGYKARMLSAEDVLPMTGYPIGGVCPFANPEGAAVYCDVSLRRFDTVFPAAGSANSCVTLSCGELAELSGCIKWVDVCKSWTKPEEI